jgi:hypothetical protein
MRARYVVLVGFAITIVIALWLRHSTNAEPAKPDASRAPPPVTVRSAQPTPRPSLPPVAPDDQVVEEPQLPDGETDVDQPEMIEEPQLAEDQRDIGVHDFELPAVAPDTIHGQVTDEQLAALPGVTIVATHGDGEPVVAITDENGYYQLPKLATGTYAVMFYYNTTTLDYELDVDGKSPVIAEPVIDTHAPPPEPITVTIDDSELANDDYKSIPVPRHIFANALGAAAGSQGDPYGDEGMSISSHCGVENTYVIEK